jgi:hypothetical protein
MKAIASIALALAACTTPSSPCGVMAAGSSLGREQSLYSCNGQFELRMQADGNLVLYHGGRSPSDAWWATGTNGWDGFRADMQGDGNFVLYTSSGTQPSDALWASDTNGFGGAQLELGDDGTMSVTRDGTVLWTDVRGDRDAAGFPSDGGGGGGGGGDECTANADCGSCEICDGGSCYYDPSCSGG